MEFDWQALLSHFALGMLVFIFFFGMIIGCLKEYRKNSIIAIDFDTLVDIDPIIERGKICAKNNNKSFDEYFDAHISEQTPNPTGLVRALKYQQLGYTLCFVSARPERLRIGAAKFLNDWNLRGELYMCENDISIVNLLKDPVKYKDMAYVEIANKIDKKLVGIIDTHAGMIGICKSERTKRT